MQFPSNRHGPSRLNPIWQRKALYVWWPIIAFAEITRVLRVEPWYKRLVKVLLYVTVAFVILFLYLAMTGAWQEWGSILMIVVTYCAIGHQYLEASDTRRHPPPYK